MSRRYGRNQKRRHREEVARLNQGYLMAAGLSTKLGIDLRAANDTISKMVDIIGAVCNHSVALAPKKVIGNAERKHYRVGAHEAVEFREITGGDRYSFAPSFRSIDLYALEVFLESRRETFQAAVHLDYSAGRSSVYMISEEALRALPREALLHRLAPDIGRGLIDYLRKGH